MSQTRECALGLCRGRQHVKSDILQNAQQGCIPQPSCMNARQHTFETRPPAASCRGQVQGLPPSLVDRIMAHAMSSASATPMLCMWMAHWMSSHADEMAMFRRRAATDCHRFTACTSLPLAQSALWRLLQPCCSIVSLQPTGPWDGSQEPPMSFSANTLSFKVKEEERCRFCCGSIQQHGMQAQPLWVRWHVKSENGDCDIDQHTQ